MAFQMAQPNRPSSSSGSSCSSSSLTPTNNNANSSLFTSEESKFITDSLSSAESFDPFTIGAPGFKVPNLLPPNLVANQADHQHMFGAQQQQQQQRQPQSMPYSSGQLNPRGWSASTAAMMLPMTTDAGLSFAYSGAGSGSSGAQADTFGQPPSSQRMDQWQNYGQNAAVGGPSDLSSGIGGGFNQTRHMSFSGAGPSSAMASGYGKNKAWQLEQLSYLNSAASAPTRFNPPLLPGGHGPEGGNSSISRSLSLAGNMDDYAQARAAASAAADAINASGSTDLAMLGLNFPSSHNFPANDQHQQQQQQQQQHLYSQQQQGSSSTSDLSNLSGTAAAMMSAGAGLDQASMSMQEDRSTTPKGSKAGPSSSGKRPWASISADRRGSGTGSRPNSSTPTQGSGEAGTAAAAGDRGRSPSVRSAWTASTSGAGLGKGRSDSHSSPGGGQKVTDRNVAVSKALAQLSSLDLDLDTASQRLPGALAGFFAPSNDEKRVQPHLDLLRRQQQEAGLVDENGKEIGKEARKAAEAEKEREAKKAAASGQGHVLLTDAEKKANHIASEQKRRANIRKGYELLCDIVPPLKEALEREAKKGGGGGGDGKDDGDEDDDEEEDDDDDDDDDDDEGGQGDDGDGKKKKVGGGSGGGASGSKKKKKKKKKVKKKESEAGGGGGGGGPGGCEIDGEKIDGRAGPRSEAVVLMKSLEHISVLLEKHRALLGRRNRARLALARAHGVEIAKSPPQQHLDVEADLMARIREAISGPLQIEGSSYAMMQD